MSPVLELGVSGVALGSGAFGAAQCLRDPTMGLPGAVLGVF